MDHGILQKQKTEKDLPFKVYLKFYISTYEGSKIDSNLTLEVGVFDSTVDFYTQTWRVFGSAW
jgi:hypothetical protein